MAKSSKHVLIASALAVGALASTPASANCGGFDPMLGSICVTGYNFCPRGYADAAGQLLRISDWSALFSLYGTIYGGDGRTTFGLPDLRGRVPVGASFTAGPGLTRVREGQKGGQQQINLNANQMPAHHHSVKLLAADANGNTDKPTGAVPARLARSNIYSASAAASGVMGEMGPSAVSQVTVGGQPVDVRDPYVGLRYCVALVGFYPSRN